MRRSQRQTLDYVRISFANHYGGRSGKPLIMLESLLQTRTAVAAATS